MYKSKQTQAGFTLIEVMVALAILAIVAAAASRVSQTHMRTTANLKARTLAHFVAQNTATDLQIAGQMIDSQTQTQVQMGGQSWQVVVTPSPLSLSNGSNSGSEAIASSGNAVQVLIQVAPIQEGTIKNTVTDLTLVLAKNDTTNQGFAGGSLGGDN